MTDKTDRKTFDGFRASVGAAVINYKNITTNGKRPLNNIPQCSGMVIDGNNNRVVLSYPFRAPFIVFLKGEGGSMGHTQLRAIVPRKKKSCTQTAIRPVSVSAIRLSVRAKRRKPPILCQKSFPAVGGAPDHGNIAKKYLGSHQVFHVEPHEEFFQQLFRHPLRDKEKMHAVHFFPVFFEGPQLVGVLIEGRTRKRGKFGHIHIINGQRKNIIHTLSDTRLGFTGQAHHEESFDTDTGFVDQAYLLGKHHKVRVLPVLGKEVFIACLNAKADHPASGLPHHPCEIKIDMLRPHSAVKGHSKRPVNHQTGEGFNPFTVKGELIVVEVDVADMKTVLEIFQVFIKIFSGIIPEAVPEDRTVAVTT